MIPIYNSIIIALATIGLATVIYVSINCMLELMYKLNINSAKQKAMATKKPAVTINYDYKWVDNSYRR